MKNKITKTLALAAAVFGLQAFTNTAMAEVPTPTVSLGFDNGKAASTILGGTAPTSMEDWDDSGVTYTKVRGSDSNYAMTISASNPKARPAAQVPDGMSDDSNWSIHGVLKLAEVNNGVLFGLCGTSWQAGRYGIGVERKSANTLQVVYWYKKTKSSTAASSYQRTIIIDNIPVSDSEAYYHSYLLTFNKDAAGTAESPYYTLYFDGVKVGDSGTAAKCTGLFANEKRWCVGTYYGGADQAGANIFSGAQIDDFAIWKDTCLSAEQAVELAAKFPPKPIQNAYLWLDASDSTTITTDSSGNVTSWASKNTGGKAAEKYTATSSSKTTMVDKGPTVSVGALDGKNVADFGNCGSKRDLQFDRTTNIRAVFMVTDIDNNGNAFILADSATGNTYHFHRGGSNFFANNASQYLREGQIRRNREAKAYNTAIGTGYGLITLIPTAGVAASRICYDRDVTESRDGGKRVAELIILTDAITDSQRDEIEQYLMDKWLPTPKTYTATVSENKAFSQLTWSPEKPAGGFRSVDVLTITNTAAAKLTIDQDVKVGTFKIENLSGSALTLGFDGHSINAAFDKSAATGGVTIDVSGVPGAEIAKYAVAGTPYSYWYIYGSGEKPDDPTTMPTMPDGYTATAQKYKDYGMRLVVTAPNTAKYGAVSISIGDDNFSSISTDLGLHPVVGNTWIKYATWSTTAQTMGSSVVTMAGCSGGAIDGTTTGLSSGALYFNHTQNDSQTDGTWRGVTLGNLNAFAEKYRVIVYMATDTSDAKYGPVKIGGVTYCGPNSGDTTGGYTIKGSTANVWGKRDATPKEGVNAVVSDVLTANTLEILAQRNYDSYKARGQICAIQIVEVDRVAAKIGDVEYPTVAAAMKAVTSGQTITLQADANEALTAAATDFTLALNGHTLSGSLATVDNSVITLTYGTNGALTATVTGSGTIVYSGVSSAPTAPTGLTASDWTGTVWFKNANVGGWDFSNFCNSSSKVKFTGVKGWLKNDVVEGVCPQGIAELVLEDDGDTLAFEMTDSSEDRVYAFTKFTGSGTFRCATSSDKACAVAIANVSDFTGKLISAAGTSANPRPIIVGSSGTAGSSSLISVANSQTIRSGYNWQAAEVAFGATLTVKGAVGDVIVSGITTAPTLNTTVTLLDPSTGSQVEGAYVLEYDSTAGAVKVARFVSPYAKFDYGIVYSWVTTTSGTVDFAGGSSNFQEFDIVGCTNKTTVYHGNTAFSSVTDGKFWHQFAYANATPMSEIYAAPGEILRLAQGSYCTSISATYGPLSFGGIIAEPGDTAFTFVNGSDGKRSNLLGDPTATTPTFFDIGANVTFNRTGAFYLAGMLTFDIASNKTNDLNSSQTSYDLALVNTVASGASGAFGTTTAGGTLVMKGAGTLKVATLKALGSTLDYSNQPYNRATPYIAGTLQMNADTMIVLPADLPANTAFKMATTLTGVTGGTAARRVIRLGDAEPAIKSVTFNLAEGTISYADDPTVFTATLTNTGYLNFQAITWDGGKTWTGGSADAYVELHIEGDGELILSLNGNVTAGTIRAVSSSENAELKINNTGSTTLSVGTFDFSDAVGKTTLNYATGTANVVAGLDTVLTSAGSGTVTIGANKKATVPTTWTGTKSLSAQGTLVVTGGGTRNYDADMVANATVELAGDTAYTFNDNQRLTTQGTLRIAAAAGTSTGGEIGMTGNTRLEVGDDGTFTINGRFVTGYGGDSRNSTIVVNGGTLTSAGYGYLMAASGYKNCTFSLNIAGGLFNAVFAPYATSGGSGIAANNINVTVSGGTFAPSKIGTSNAKTGSQAVITEGGEDIGTVGSGKGAKVDMTGGTFNVPAIVPSWLPINVTSGEATIGVQTGVANAIIRSVITVSGGKLNLPAGLASTNVTLSAGATLNVTTNTPGQAAYSITTGTFENSGTVQLNGVNLPTDEYEVSGNQIVKKGAPAEGAIHATVSSEVNWSAIEWYNSSEQKIGTITDFSKVTSAALTVESTGIVTINNWGTISGLAATLTIGGAGKVAYTTSGTTPALPTWTWKGSGDDAWTGTYALSGLNGSINNWNPTTYYNGTNSKFEFGGTLTGGWFWQSNVANNMFGELILTGSISFTDGHTHPTGTGSESKKIIHYCFTKLSGNGNITINTSSAATTALRFSDVSAYTGALSVDSTNTGGNGYRIFLGSGTLEASGDTPTRAAIHVTGNATLGSATYTAKNGIIVHNPASVGGTATLASNATFYDDAEIDVRSGNVLTANGTLTFGETTKVRVTTAPLLGESVKIISKSGTTAGPISTAVSVYVGTGDTPVAEPAYAIEYKTDGVYLTAESYKTLGWDAAQSAWTNAEGVVTTIDNTCILNAKAGDVITFASAVTPHEFNMPNSGTVTLGTGGYHLHHSINVPASAKLVLGWDSTTAYAQVISGAGAVDVTGNVTLSANNTFTGALTVKNDATLTMGSNSCLNNSNAATVEAGGTLDINGQKGRGALNFTLAGGSLVNNGTSMTHGEQQMVSITLTADSTIGGTGNFGLVTTGYNATQLHLGTHTLTKTGSGSFWICNTTIDGTGTLAVQEGTVDLHSDRDSSFTTGTLKLTGGTLAVASGRILTLAKLTVDSGTVSNSGTISGLAEIKGTIDLGSAGTITLADSVAVGTEGGEDVITVGSLDLTSKSFTVNGGTLNLAQDGTARSVGGLTIEHPATLVISTNETAAAVAVTGSVDLGNATIVLSGLLPAAGGTAKILSATDGITNYSKALAEIRGEWTINVTDNILTATKKKANYVKPGAGGNVSDVGNDTDSLDIGRDLAIKATKDMEKKVTDGSTTEQVVDALNQTGANTYKVWESAVLGLDPTNAASQLVITPIQGSSTTTVTLQVPTVNVNETTGADVTFCFWSKTADGDWAEVQGGVVKSGEQKELALPEDGVMYYQLRTTIKAGQLTPIPTVIPSANIVAAGAPVMTTPGTQNAASMGTKTLDAVSSSLTVGLAGAGVYEGQEYHLEVTEPTNADENHFAIVAKADANKTVTFHFGKNVPAGTTCKLTLLSASGAPNGNVAVKPDEGFEGVTYDNVMVTAMLANRPHLDDLGGVADHTGYRIPAVATDGNGEVIACYDVRDYKSSSWTDLGHDTGIDVGESYSKDRGVNFNVPKRGINVQNCYAHPNKLEEYSKHTDMGDVCMVWDPSREQYWILGMTGNGLAGSNTNLNDVVVYTRVRGENSKWTAWHNPDLEGVSEELDYRSIQHTIMSQVVGSGSSGKGFLQGPGHGMVTKIGKGDTMPIGTVVFPVQYFIGTAQAGAIYLKPGTPTVENNWKATGRTTADGSQENCVMELDDGSWYMMCKKPSQGTGDPNRYKAWRTVDFTNWVDVDDGLSDVAAVQGSCLKIGSKNNIGQYVFCHVNASTRRNLTMFFGHDTTKGETGTIPSTTNRGIQWDMEHPLVINSTDSGGMMYNSLCMLDDHTIGVLYEYNWHIYFTRIDVSDKVDTPAK